MFKANVVYFDLLSAEQVERHDVENVASVVNCFEKSRGKNVTSCDVSAIIYDAE